ncbi:MAG: replicative DNA helicase [Candidatus Tyloplasma litorale]|nr:MAG: replicative DNA helicase [Mycoplasmatales bacterium]
MKKKLHSEKAENSLLGLFIERLDLFKKNVGILEPEDFFIKENQIVYSSLLNIVSKNDKMEKIDYVLLFEEISKLSDKEPNFWQDYLTTLIYEQGIEDNIPKYFTLIKDKKHSRDLKNTLISSADLVSKTDDSIESLIGQVESRIFEITQNREIKDFIDLKNISEEYKKKIENLKNGVTTEGISLNFKKLDEKLGGLKGGQFIIIAARPSIGKTAFSLEITKNVAINGNRVAFISLEMPSDQLFTRLITSESKTSFKSLISKGQNEISKYKLDEAIKKVSALKIWIDDSPTMKINELIWKVRKFKRINDINMVVIDYLQLIQDDEKSNESRQQMVSNISRKLKALARELDIPIIALSQLSRKVEDRNDKRPIMSDIRESGAIEQDADIIMFLYRDDYYENDSENKGPLSNLEVNVAKHRNGSTGKINLGLNLETGAITSQLMNFNKKI